MPIRIQPPVTRRIPVTVYEEVNWDSLSDKEWVFAVQHDILVGGIEYLVSEV